MSTLGVLSTGLLWLTWTTTLTAQTIDFATPVARKAVAAVGPAETQRELLGFTCNTEATFTLDDNSKVKVNGTFSAGGVDQFRGDVMPVINGTQLSLVFVLSGKKGWGLDTVRNRVTKLEGDVLEVFRADILAVRLAQRPTILLENRTELSTLGFFEIDKERAEGLKVKVRNMPEVDLFFSRKTGLPIKATARVLEPGGAEVEHTFLFQDWKAVNGVKQFHKLVMFRDDKKTFDMQFTNVNLQKSVQKSLFAEPE